MEFSFNILFPKFEILVVFLCAISCICGRRYAEAGYYPDSYYNGQPYNKIETALSKLEHTPQWVNDWPDASVKLGQVSGVALDNEGRLLVFHRASNVWDANTFTNRDVYQGIGEPPIPHATVLVFNDTGELVDMWGQNLFYIPHGITMDKDGNVFTTDVALHQVLKFDAGNWQKPSMVLGEKFVPGNDDQHFCKPAAVAVLPTGDFFVADGYCNQRIIKMAFDGSIILQWGRSHGDSPFTLNVPHALTLAPDRNLVCVADREHGRVACFRADNGTFASSYSSWLAGPRLFSVAYAPAHGGRLYIVNGPGGSVPVRGYAIDFASGRLIGTFGAEDGFSNPHDIVTTPDGSKVYVAELNPYRVYKLIDTSLQNATLAPQIEKKAEAAKSVNTTHAKPTATIEVRAAGGAGARAWWWGALGGAAGAALLALAAAALQHASHSGRKNVARRRWEYGQGEFKLRRLLERRRFTRVHSDDSDEEPSPMLRQPPRHCLMRLIYLRGHLFTLRLGNIVGGSRQL